jgi:hypothetical protein
MDAIMRQLSNPYQLQQAAMVSAAAHQAALFMGNAANAAAVAAAAAAAAAARGGGASGVMYNPAAVAAAAALVQQQQAQAQAREAVAGPRPSALAVAEGQALVPCSPCTAALASSPAGAAFDQVNSPALAAPPGSQAAPTPAAADGVPPAPQRHQYPPKEQQQQQQQAWAAQKWAQDRSTAEQMLRQSQQQQQQQQQQQLLRHKQPLGASVLPSFNGPTGMAPRTLAAALQDRNMANPSGTGTATALASGQQMLAAAAAAAAGGHPFGQVMSNPWGAVLQGANAAAAGGVWGSQMQAAAAAAAAPRAGAAAAAAAAEHHVSGLNSGMRSYGWGGSNAVGASAGPGHASGIVGSSRPAGDPLTAGGAAAPAAGVPHTRSPLASLPTSAPTSNAFAAMPPTTTTGHGGVVTEGGMGGMLVPTSMAAAANRGGEPGPTAAAAAAAAGMRQPITRKRRAATQAQNQPLRPRGDTGAAGHAAGLGPGPAAAGAGGMGGMMQPVSTSGTATGTSQALPLGMPLLQNRDGWSSSCWPANPAGAPSMSCWGSAVAGSSFLPPGMNHLLPMAGGPGSGVATGSYIPQQWSGMQQQAQQVAGGGFLHAAGDGSGPAAGSGTLLPSATAAATVLHLPSSQMQVPTTTVNAMPPVSYPAAMGGNAWAVNMPPGGAQAAAGQITPQQVALTGYPSAGGGLCAGGLAAAGGLGPGGAAAAGSFPMVPLSLAAAAGPTWADVALQAVQPASLHGGLDLGFYYQYLMALNVLHPSLLVNPSGLLASAVAFQAFQQVFSDLADKTPSLRSSAASQESAKDAPNVARNDRWAWVQAGCVKGPLCVCMWLGLSCNSEYASAWPTCAGAGCCAAMLGGASTCWSNELHTIADEGEWCSSLSLAHDILYSPICCAAATPYCFPQGVRGRPPVSGGGGGTRCFRGCGACCRAAGSSGSGCCCSAGWAQADGCRERERARRGQQQAAEGQEGPALQAWLEDAQHVHQAAALWPVNHCRYLLGGRCARCGAVWVW